jgi:hypothetical protein
MMRAIKFFGEPETCLQHSSETLRWQCRIQVQGVVNSILLNWIAFLGVSGDLSTYGWVFQVEHFFFGGGEIP